MTLGSLFDGAGTCPLAGVITGFIPVWASEIESFPISVTKKRFPGMKHLGDVTKINGAEIAPVDLITFGSPCQDLSVAGKRAGIKHKGNGDEETTRSGLFMEAVRIIKEMRGATDGKYPRFAMWENVPGAFSSNDGEDFRIVLEELCRVKDRGANVPRPQTQRGRPSWRNAGAILGDGYSLAWRVLDAQFWGVPQRRLTPTECARLQGMPDWWCQDIKHSDAAEYKMWGNGMALPCVLYVFEGIRDMILREGENHV